MNNIWVIAWSIPTATWIDQLQAWGTVAGVLVALIGIGAIYSTVQETRKQQRTQAMPYVRVDLGVSGKTGSDFQPPPVHYTNTSIVVDLDASIPNHDKVIISAWLSNYQTHPLGFAVAVTLKVQVSVFSATDGYSFSGADAKVAYLEHGKPVRIDLIKAKKPTNSRDAIFVEVVRLEYSDFYDEAIVHVRATKGTNALHGRLELFVTSEKVSNLPQSWPRGNQVTYDEIDEA